MGLDRKAVWVALGAILVTIIISRLPALSNVIHSYPNDTARWAAPAVNFATYGVENSFLPLVDQGDYGHITGRHYFRWPLLPFYIYGFWASITSDELLALRLVPFALNLITTFYCFLIASLLFRKVEWALVTTLLFALIPGHFFMSVQVSDTQFWIAAFAGGIFHRIRYEQTGDSKHMSAHIGLLVMGCLCSWFGYLCVGAHFCLGIGSEIFQGRGKPLSSTLFRVFNRYRSTLLGFAVVSLAAQLALLRWLAGPTGFNMVSERFFFWVTNRTNHNEETNFAIRVLSRWPDLLYTIWSFQFPRLLGWPLIAVCLAAPAVIASQFDRVKKMIHWELFVRLVVIYSLCFAGYLGFFTHHASRSSHVFAYQQLSPIIAICAVLTIAIVAGYKRSGRSQLVMAVICCVGLVMPRFIDYYVSPNLNTEEKGQRIESARAFGEMVKMNSLRSDFVITNGASPSGIAERVAKFTARRTLDFEKNEWKEVSRYLVNDLIKGVVFLYRRDVPNEFKADGKLLSELKIQGRLIGETDELVVYRLK